MKIVATELIKYNKNQLVTPKEYVENLYTIYEHVSIPCVYYAKRKEHNDEIYMLDYSIETLHCKEIEYEEYFNLIANKKIELISIDKIKNDLLKSLCNYIAKRGKQLIE